MLSYGYPRQANAFQQALAIPVFVETKRPLMGALAAALPTPIPAFNVRIKDAIRAIERRVFVEGMPDNPLELVESYVSAFTWEFDTFWTVDNAQDAYYPNVGRNLSLTIEHVARSGELIAEGIALQFLEQRLGISRANCSYIAPSGNAARLDYAFTPIHGTRMDVLCPGFPRLQLEVRSRKEMTALAPRDHKRLAKKKAGTVSGHALSIYCSYGEPSATFSGCRLILADPGDDEEVGEDEAQATSLINYERVTGRIGLWHHNSILRREIRARHLSTALPPASYDEEKPPVKVPLVRRPLPDGPYGGRYFAQALVESARDADRARNVLKRADVEGDLGTLTFHGVHVDVLDMIDASNWASLAGIIDRGGWTEVRTKTDGMARSDDLSPRRANIPDDAIVTGDGVYRLTEPLIRSTPEGEEVLRILRQRARR